jgi:site-specific DNA recombinase
MVIGIYCRVSSETQKNEGESLITQRDNGVDFCKRNNYEFQVYNEGGRSGGSIKKRKEYLQLIDDIKNGLIDGVWIFSTSRLNRESYEFLLFIKICIENKIKLFVGDREEDLSSSETLLKLQIMGSFDEYFRSINTHQSVSNKLRRAREGRWVNGTVPFGYNKDDGKLIVSNKKKEVIHKVLDWYIEGYSKKKIVRELLMEYGGEEIDGKEYKFNEHWVRKILIRDYYVTGKVSMTLSGNSFDYGVESICDRDKWEKANRIYKTTLKEKRIDKVSWLEGLLICYQCGSNIHLVKANGWKKKDGTRKVYYYTRCESRKHNGKPLVGVPYKEVEDDLLRFVDKFLLKEGLVFNKIRSMILDEIESEREKSEVTVDEKKIIKEIDKLKQRRNRIEQFYLEVRDGWDEKTFKEEDEKIDVEIDNWKRKLNNLSPKVDLLEMKINDWLVEIEDLDKISPIEFIQNYVERIKFRVVKRKWFVNGRLLKYNFVFKGLNIEGSDIDRIVRDSKKNRENLLPKRILNTNKIFLDKWCVRIDLEINFNSFVFEIESINFIYSKKS